MASLSAGVLGAVASYAWQAHRLQAARDSALSVVVVPDVGEYPGDGTTWAAASDGRTIKAQLSGHVAVVNAGPAPLTLVRLSAEGRGLVLQSSTPERAAAPGTSVTMAFNATVDCPVGGALSPIYATVWVQTAAEVRRSTTVTFDGQGWQEQVETTCNTKPHRP